VVAGSSPAGPTNEIGTAKRISPQFLRSSLPRAEYEALLKRADHEAEDADDVAIYDARKAELAAGGVVLEPPAETWDGVSRFSKK
jgi:hypothetical protein